MFTLNKRIETSKSAQLINSEIKSRLQGNIDPKCLIVCQTIWSEYGTKFISDLTDQFCGIERLHTIHCEVKRKTGRTRPSSIESRTKLADINDVNPFIRMVCGKGHHLPSVRFDIRLNESCPTCSKNLCVGYQCPQCQTIVCRSCIQLSSLHKN